jgi:hypothetical protein
VVKEKEQFSSINHESCYDLFTTNEGRSWMNNKKKTIANNGNRVGVQAFILRLGPVELVTASVAFA